MGDTRSPRSRIEHINAASLIVVKIGSGALTRNGRLDRRTVARLAGDLVFVRRSGRQIIAVSSGAIASGLKPLGFSGMPRTIVEKQAAAAIGQQVLMSAWAESFKKARVHVAQVLLTADDLDDRSRYLNARHTIQELLAHGVVPIVNENDSVAFDEIKLGDNDHLSALVSTLVSAQLLIMLTDVEGLRRGGPHGKLIDTVGPGESVTAHVTKAKSATGVGGMATKIEAARLVGDAGIPTIIASGKRKEALRGIVAGQIVGTFFEPRESPLDPRRRWIATATRSRGIIVVDSGARSAIVRRNASLLPSGVVDVEGRFSAGSVVRICDEQGRPFARGLASYASDEILRVRGRRGAELPSILGYKYMDEIVHRNDLVLTPQAGTRKPGSGPDE